MKTENEIKTKKEIKFEDLNYRDKQKVIKSRRRMGIIEHSNSGRGIKPQYHSPDEKKAEKRKRKEQKKEQSRLAKIERRKKLKISTA
jgi:hypothetical protein